MQDTANFGVAQDIAVDQLLVDCPLGLEHFKRFGIDHATAWSELVYVNVNHGACLIDIDSRP
jgi:hypothetical protein